ncbi:MAG: hypothetical protein LBV71_11120 [Prevotella sp.]|nr:hypothetical protein [Prevotella sp.]
MITTGCSNGTADGTKIEEPGTNGNPSPKGIAFNDKDRRKLDVLHD